jgi:hypothetical protein
MISNRVTMGILRDGMVSLNGINFPSGLIGIYCCKDRKFASSKYQ